MMALFGLDDGTLRERIAALRGRLGEPGVRDRLVNIALGAGVAIVFGMAIYMIMKGR
ncbi:hypothetical protein L6Q96_06140 [Candidatus Binatia bacterium]|nr:hypothetical protein [Candidatus Binatia bacterium]